MGRNIYIPWSVKTCPFIFDRNYKIALFVIMKKFLSRIKRKKAKMEIWKRSKSEVENIHSIMN